MQDNGYIRYDHLPLETKDGKRGEVEFISNVYQVDRRSVAQCNIRDISERTRLERKTLEQSEALADLHRRKDEFIAMLGHELRNPLAAISNGVQLLSLQKNEGQLQQKARAIIERQVGQLTRLVDDLLEVARITTGRFIFNKNVTLNGIVRNGIETVYTLISQRRHSLKVSIPPDPIWVYADASRLEQVVVNLLTNAAKYTHDGGQISFSVEEEGTDCVLSVRDSGVGIAPELLPRIFDLFTQAERSLDRSQGGLGIGLALVERLVAMHGGKRHRFQCVGERQRIRRPSADGDGHRTTIARRCPRKPADYLDPPCECWSLTTTWIRQKVWQCCCTRQGMMFELLMMATALDAALSYLPNVMLLDIGLPELDGYEVARRFREQPARKSWLETPR